MEMSRGRGFSLLELLVVLIIASLVITLVGASFSSAVETARWKKSAREMLFVLKRARSQAITQGVVQRFSVDRDSQRYSVADNVYDWPSAVSLSLSLRSWSSASGDAPRATMNDGLMFYPDGSSTGGQLSIASQQGILVVNVDWLTGRVMLSES